MNHQHVVLTLWLVYHICFSFMFQLCSKKLPWDDFFFFFLIKTNPHHEGQHAHQQYEVKDSFLPEAQAHTWKSSCCTGGVIFLSVIVLKSLRVSVSAQVYLPQGLMMEWCPTVSAAVTGSHYAAFMCWMSLLFPVMRRVRMRKSSKRQTGLNVRTPLGGCCCHFSAPQLIGQMNQTRLCRPHCRSPRCACLA